ncbi:MAG: type II secretion system protein [Oscillospiraceae bacterium]
MNSKKIGSKLKGFTLIELIVVMAIIAVLAGILSILISGFQRDARMEADNNKAQMVYTGMQNQLIQCEIKQDRSLIDAGAHYSPSVGSSEEIKYVELYFEMGEGKLGDAVNVKSLYDGGTVAIRSAERNHATTGKWYNELEKAILSFVDDSFDGGVAVYIDYENFVVDSVIYIESAFFEADLSNYSTSIAPFMADKFNGYADFCTWGDTTKVFRMLDSMDKQKECIKYKGMYFGAYPMISDYPVDKKPA